MSCLHSATRVATAVNRSSRPGTDSMRAGHRFEAAVVRELEARFPGAVLRVAGGRVTPARLAATRDALAAKAPIVYQGALCNPADHTFGVPDLLVLGEVLREGFGVPAEPGAHHVVDVKNTLAWLGPRGELLDASGAKAQLWVYARALAVSMDAPVLDAFVLARAYLPRHADDLHPALGPLDTLARVCFEREPALCEAATAAVAKISSQQYTRSPRQWATGPRSPRGSAPS